MRSQEKLLFDFRTLLNKVSCECELAMSIQNIDRKELALERIHRWCREVSDDMEPSIQEYMLERNTGNIQL